MSDDAKTTTPTITVAETADHIERNDAFVLDLRSGHIGKQIYGAIQYDPKKLLDAPRLVLPLPKTSGLIVLYDEKGDGDRLEAVAEKLRNDGYADLRVLEGGFKAWQDADGRTEERTIEQAVPLVSTHQLDR